MMSDGAIYAGVERVLNYGWQRENIIAYVEANYNYKQTAKIIASEIADECKPSLRFRARRRHNCCRSSDSEAQDLQPFVRTSEHPEDDNKVMALFFSKQGRHVVCGGTTSKITARYLGKEIVAAPDYSDPSIPPTASIEGCGLSD